MFSVEGLQGSSEVVAASWSSEEDQTTRRPDEGKRKAKGRPEEDRRKQEQGGTKTQLERVKIRQRTEEETVMPDEQGIKLLDGSFMPSQGFGTYKICRIPGASGNSNGSLTVIEEHDMYSILLAALNTGFRLFDCAEFYENHELIGEALERIFDDAGNPYQRADVYLVTKVWNSSIYEGEEAIRTRVDEYLRDLKTDYLDLLLVHWPVPGKHVQAYKTLEALKEEGKVRSIGVSNYLIEDYKELMQPENNIKFPPVVNQLEVNPFLFRKTSISYFQQQEVVIQAYRCLSNGKLNRGSTFIEDLAKKYGVTRTKILVKFLHQQKIVPITKTSKKERMRENFLDDQALGISLSSEEIAQLSEFTTSETLETFKETYLNSCVRLTPLEEQYKSGKDVGLKEVPLEP